MVNKEIESWTRVAAAGQRRPPALNGRVADTRPVRFLCAPRTLRPRRLECPANTLGIDQGVARARLTRQRLSVNLRPAAWWRGSGNGPQTVFTVMTQKYNNKRKNISSGIHIIDELT